MSYGLRPGISGQGGRWLRAMLSPVMSPTAFFMDFYVYPLLVLACLVIAFATGESGHALGYVLLVLFGYLSWTLIEYLVHRFVLHHVAWLRGMHEAHHHAPNELIGTPTVFSMAVFYCLAYTPAAMIWGRPAAAAWMAGLLTGYLSYVVAHWAVHHVGSGGYRILRRLKRQHALHHHVSQQRNFGVTTAFWDMVFRTGGR